MSFARDSLLFGIALIAFGTWIEVHGMGGWPFAVAGLVLGAVAFLGSVYSWVRSVSRSNAPVTTEKRQ